MQHRSSSMPRVNVYACKRQLCWGVHVLCFLRVVLWQSEKLSTTPPLPLPLHLSMLVLHGYLIDTPSTYRDMIRRTLRMHLY